MDLLRVSSPYKSMKDSLKEKLLEYWVENYSDVYKEIKIVKDKIEHCVLVHNREGIPLYIPKSSVSIRIQKTLYPFSDRMWNQIVTYTSGNPWNIITFLKNKLCLFDKDIYIGTVTIVIDCDDSGKLKIVRSPEDFPWVIELKEFVDKYTKLYNQFIKEILELLKKFCLSPLNNENKLMNLIKYGRVEEINL